MEGGKKMRENKRRKWREEREDEIRRGERAKQRRKEEVTK